MTLCVTSIQIKNFVVFQYFNLGILFLNSIFKSCEDICQIKNIKFRGKIYYFQGKMRMRNLVFEAPVKELKMSAMSMDLLQINFDIFP